MKPQNRHIVKYLMLLLLLVLPVNWASADDPDAVVRIECNPKAFLQIEQYWEEAPMDPYPRVVLPSDMVISMRGLMWAKESPQGTVTWEEKPARRVCRIKNTKYTLELKGYKFNTNPQGECGAGSPTLSLTICKDQKLIARDLIFDYSCSPVGVGVILSIKLDPQKPYAELEIMRDKWQDHKEKVLVPLDKGITRKIIFNEQ